ncbi:MAG: hypothetical protein COA58_05340 [Bacteroidetes bacterium]|nr:MAG: hypothetical protein COA58_05340 [Bacteroidota bacterium]
MVKASILIMIILVFGFESTAQENPNNLHSLKVRTAQVDVKTIISRNFNLGLSAGAGGGHPLYIIPQATLRLGRLSMSGVVYSPFIQGKLWSLNGDVELLRFKNRSRLIDSNTLLSISGGTTRRTIYTQYGRDATRTPYVLVGLTKYLKNERSRISFKIGTMYYWTSKNVPAKPWPIDPNPWVITTSPWPEDVEEYKWLAYGELSYQIYLFKIRKKQIFVNQRSEKVTYRKWKEENKLEKQTEILKSRQEAHERWVNDTMKFDWNELFRYNFNPGLSLGMGGGRLKYGVPNLAIRMGNWTASFMPGQNEGFYGRDFAMQMDLEFPWSLSKKKQVFLAASLGGSFVTKKSISIGKEIYKSQNLGTMMFGVHIPMSNNRSRLALRGGFATIWNLHFESYRRPFYNTEKYIPYGEIAYQIYAMPFGHKQKVLRNVLTGKVKFNGQRVKEGFAQWFNPFWSIGAGLDRAIWTPALGLKIGPVNAKGSFWIQYVGGYGAFNINADLVKLKSKKEFNKYLGFGLNYFGSSSGEIHSTSTDILGGTLNLNLYKKNGRSGLELKAGIAYQSRTQSSYDWETSVYNNSSSKKIVLNGGLSYNIYLFRME